MRDLRTRPDAARGRVRSPQGDPSRVASKPSAPRQPHHRAPPWVRPPPAYTPRSNPPYPHRESGPASRRPTPAAVPQGDQVRPAHRLQPYVVPAARSVGPANRGQYCHQSPGNSVQSAEAKHTASSQGQLRSEPGSVRRQYCQQPGQEFSAVRVFRRPRLEIQKSVGLIPRVVRRASPPAVPSNRRRSACSLSGSPALLRSPPSSNVAAAQTVWRRIPSDEANGYGARNVKDVKSATNGSSPTVKQG